MKLFGFNISISRTAPPVTRSFTPEQWLRGDDLDLNRCHLVNAYEQVVWVYRAIQVIAEQIANIPFLFSNGERGRENLITSGPLIDFYNHPHPHINRFQYWELRILWLMLRGESIRIPIYESSSASSPSSSSSSLAAPKRSEAGSASSEEGLNKQSNKSEIINHTSPPTPLEMARQLRDALHRDPPPSSTFEAAKQLRDLLSEVVPDVKDLRVPRPRLHSVLLVDPSQFQHVVENHQIIGWRYTGRSPNAPLESRVFLPEEIWFERLPNPFDFWRGLPPMCSADLPAKTDFAAASFMRGIIENNAETGLIVRGETQLTDEQRAQISAALRDRKRAAGAADRSVLLWGATEVVRPQLSSADLQFLENRKFSRAEICAAFGVPEEIITATDHAKYDVMQGARLNFIENRIAPLCARLEAEEQRTIRAIDPNAVGWFDLDSLPIMQAARRSRISIAKTGFEMGIPFNDLNRVLDLGFKPLPWGDSGYLSSNLSPISPPKSSSSSSPVGDDVRRL